MVIEKAAEKMKAVATRYEVLYTECHAQIAKYHRSSIEAQIIGGIGVATKGLGKAIAAVPIIREGPVDEALINAGDSIGKFNRDTAQKRLEAFEPFADSRMGSFIENIQTLDLLYNTENAMLTDGSNLYVLKDPA